MDVGGRWRISGVVAGLTLAYLFCRVGVAEAAPPALALCLAVGVLIGEVVLPRPEPKWTARASLEVRRIRDFVPAIAVWSLLALAPASLAIIQLVVIRYAAIAVPPTGGFLTRSADPAAVLFSVLVTLLIGGTVAGAVLVSVVRSPRQVADPAQQWRDDDWRYRNSSAVVAAGGVLAAAMTAAVGLSAPPFGDGPTGVIMEIILSISLAIAVVTLAVFIGLLLRSRPRQRRRELVIPAWYPSPPRELPIGRVVARAPVPHSPAGAAPAGKPEILVVDLTSQLDDPTPEPAVPEPAIPAQAEADPTPIPDPPSSSPPASAAASVSSGELPAVTR